MELFELIKRLSGSSIRRAFLIANNKNLNIENVLKLITSSEDIVLQFNQCIFENSLKHKNLKSIFLFHLSDGNGRPHGFSLDYSHNHEFDAYDYAIAVFVDGVRDREIKKTWCIPELSIPSYFVQSELIDKALIKIDERYFDSIGFFSVLLLHLINIKAFFEAQQPIQIILCGFSGEYPGGGYLGHDFYSEQTVLRLLPNLYFLNEHNEPEVPGSIKPILIHDKIHHALKTVFNDNFDYYSIGKPGLIFEIAKLFYSANDIKSFDRLTRISLDMNVAYPQEKFRWILKASELLDKPRQALELQADYLETIKKRNQVKQRWHDFNCFLQDHYSEYVRFDHNACYILPTTACRRILIINETSAMPYNAAHAGCHHVNENMRKLLADRKIQVAGWANNLKGLNLLLNFDPHHLFDGVIINGEGTMHHNADRAFEILLIAQFLKDLGKPIFLINTVWQDNGDWINKLCKHVDIFTVRESCSFEEIKTFRNDVRLVPDLCWLNSTNVDSAPPGEGLAFQDCVLDDQSLLLEQIAVQNKLPFFVMHRYPQALSRAFLGDYPEQTIPRVLRMQDIRAYDGWVSGRFHGIIMSLQQGVPVVAVTSNTHKNESLLRDIGLKGKMMTKRQIESLPSPIDVEDLFSGQRIFTATDWNNVRSYTKMALVENERLFDDIANWW
jgi:hypothetical protein